jgi:hypothetical protein
LQFLQQIDAALAEPVTGNCLHCWALNELRVSDQRKNDEAQTELCGVYAELHEAHAEVERLRAALSCPCSEYTRRPTAASAATTRQDNVIDYKKEAEHLMVEAIRLIADIHNVTQDLERLRTATDSVTFPELGLLRARLNNIANLSGANRVVFNAVTGRMQWSPTDITPDGQWRYVNFAHYTTTWKDAEVIVQKVAGRERTWNWVVTVGKEVMTGSANNADEAKDEALRVAARMTGDVT